MKTSGEEEMGRNKAFQKTEHFSKFMRLVNPQVLLSVSLLQQNTKGKVLRKKGLFLTPVFEAPSP